MQRGGRLFNTLFDDFDPLPSRGGKGRSAEHDARRNEALIARYYYLGYYTNQRYSDIVMQLSCEFYLSHRRIQDIVQECSAALHRLRQQQPAPGWFSQQYPHIIWPVVR